MYTKYVYEVCIRSMYTKYVYETTSQLTVAFHARWSFLYTHTHHTSYHHTTSKYKRIFFTWAWIVNRPISVNKNVSQWKQKMRILLLVLLIVVLLFFLAWKVSDVSEWSTLKLMPSIINCRMANTMILRGGIVNVTGAIVNRTYGIHKNLYPGMFNIFY